MKGSIVECDVDMLNCAMFLCRCSVLREAPVITVCPVHRLTCIQARQMATLAVGLTALNGITKTITVLSLDVKAIWIN